MTKKIRELDLLKQCTAFGLGLGLIVLSVTSCHRRIDEGQKDTGKETAAQTKLEQESGQESSRITTLRNAIEIPITYAIKIHRSKDIAEEHTLEPGEIHSFAVEKSLDVSFLKSTVTMTLEVEPGAPYTFRHNERNELELYPGSHGRADVVDLAPYVATPYEVVDKMLEMAQVSPSDVVYDIGCGDGRIVIAAALDYGVRGVGIDIVPERIIESRVAAKEAGVDHLVEFRLEDATKSDLSEATIVTLYLVPESTRLLKPILEEKLNYRTTVISHGYPIPGWEDRIFDYVQMETLDKTTHIIYGYRL